jgi:phosphoglycerol transferase MdoB-like AlkP superfamily enzyme
MKTTVSRAQARHMPKLKSPIWLFVILFFYLPPRQFIFVYWFMFSFSLALLLIYCVNMSNFKDNSGLGKESGSGSRE